MLVLTRRENEKILLPDLGVSIELMSVSGNRARLGISAPNDIRILREEVATDRNAITQQLAKGPIRREFAHAMSNRLNAAILAAEMLRLQFEYEATEALRQPLEKLIAELNEMAGMLRSTVTATPAATSTRCRAWRALLVEDDANESNLLAGYLRMTGFEVDTAGDGADALDYLHSHQRPDSRLVGHGDAPLRWSDDDRTNSPRSEPRRDEDFCRQRNFAEGSRHHDWTGRR